jgi:mannose-1-phosphate guanylyltransferase
MGTYAVIMAGGAGTRFWPASRERLPKQLLALAGKPGEPLLAATVRRLAPLVQPADVYVATGAHLVEGAARALPAVPRAQLLAEPVPRNTAPCIGWAAATIARKDPDAVIAVLPSDHHIGDEEAFRRVVSTALEAAKDDYLVTIGITPTRPETGYGYIEVGAPLAGRAGLSSVERFVEKPNTERAAQFLAGGKHLWNGGMFFFRARTMLRAIQDHLPELARGLAQLDDAAKKGDEGAALHEIFASFPSISIDHGVMEKARPLAVVRGDGLGWSDVGSWESAWELAPKDTHGNALPPGAVTVDAKNNFALDLRSDSRERVVGLVGVSDLVVVQTDDALLVIPRARAQEVRSVVDALKKAGRGHV